MESTVTYEGDLNLKATELRLGLPGTDESEKEKPMVPVAARNNKRPLTGSTDESKSASCASDARDGDRETRPAAKEQVVGWPPIRSYRKNSFQPKKTEADPAGIYVKVSMDGAPYLRKIDLKLYKGYPELLKALEDMFKFKDVRFMNLVLVLQVSTQREKDTMVPSMHLRMRTKMVTGCWLEMFHGICSSPLAKE